MCLDHLRIGILNSRAVGMFHVLRERVLSRKSGGGRKGKRTSSDFESVLHNYSLLMTFTPTLKYKIETFFGKGFNCNNSVAKVAFLRKFLGI
jgi:hypothetical protein